MNVKRAKYGRLKGLEHHDLNIDALNMPASEESSFFNYDRMAIYFGWIPLLTDNTHILTWISHGKYKGRCVACLVPRVETYVFVDCFDVALSLRYDIRKTNRRTLSFTIPTDSDAVFKILVKLGATSVFHLMSNISAARKMFGRDGTTTTGWVRSMSNISDVRTEFDL